MDEGRLEKVLATLDADVKQARGMAAVIQGIVVVIIVGVMGWVATEVQTLGKDVIAIRGKLESINSQFDSTDRFLKLELSQAKGALEATIIENKRVSAENRRLLDQVWPRLRAHDANMLLLKKEIEDQHPGVVILFVRPEKF